MYTQLRMKQKKVRERVKDERERERSVTVKFGVGWLNLIRPFLAQEKIYKFIVFALVCYMSPCLHQISTSYFSLLLCVYWLFFVFFWLQYIGFNILYKVTIASGCPSGSKVDSMLSLKLKLEQKKVILMVGQLTILKANTIIL